MKDWKTTLAGLVALGAVVIHYWLPQFSGQWQALIGLATALGLIAAKDAKKETP